MFILFIYSFMFILFIYLFILFILFIFFLNYYYYFFFFFWGGGWAGQSSPSIQGPNYRIYGYILEVVAPEV